LVMAAPWGIGVINGKLLAFSDHRIYVTPPLPIHPRSSQIGVGLRNPAPD